MAFIVIGYYTKDSFYKNQARKLRKTLDKFSLPHKLYPVDGKGEWVHNCAIKPKIIAQALNEHKEDIVYLDVDARVMRYPDYFDIFPGHFGVHYRDGIELVSNTMYFKNCELCKAMVELWVQAQEANPDEWDQRVLQEVVIVMQQAVKGFDVVKLPSEYSHMEGIYHHNPKAVIRQIQVSRQVRNRPGLVQA